MSDLERKKERVNKFLESCDDAELAMIFASGKMTGMALSLVSLSCRSTTMNEIQLATVNDAALMLMTALECTSLPESFLAFLCNPRNTGGN